MTKVTDFNPAGLPIALGGWSTGYSSIGSNTDSNPPLSALNFVQRITSNTSNTLLNPIVNFAAGSNIALSASSNTITITGAATSGGGGGGTTITTKDEGTTLSSTVTTLDFVGAGVTASGAGATTTVTISGGGSGIAQSYLGYNTVGGSTQTMTVQRVYCKQITTSATATLVGIQAYIDQTVEAVLSLIFVLQADSGSDTIGDLLQTYVTPNMVLAHGTGGGVSYPARWVGAAMGYQLAASTKYWIGVAYHGGTGAPRLYYDTSGSDRYYTGGVTPYYNDGAYNAGTQTNTTNKHSIRANILS